MKFRLLNLLASKWLLLRYTFTASLVPLFLFSFVSASSGSIFDLNENNINSIKAVVDDEIITQNEVIRHSAAAIKEAQKEYKDEYELMHKIEEILENTLEELINRKVLVKEANRIFSTNDALMKEVEKDLDHFVKGAVKNVGSLSKYYEIAESQGINPVEKKNQLREDIMIDKIMKENVYNKVRIQPKLLRRYYSDHIDEFTQEKEVNLRHIMIRFSAHNNDKKETFAVAQHVMNKIKNGEDFATLAKQYSEGHHADEGGLWSIEEVNELRKDLRDVAYSLKDNEYSEIVESPVGYHIFKMELVKPRKVQEFEDVQEEIYKQLYIEEISRLKKQYIDRLKSGMFIKIIR